MPIRTIPDKQYKGVSELYRKSDGQVTGFYVTYRDTDGKPIKKRVEADNKDEALLKLIEIKQSVDSDKKGKPMGTTFLQPDKKMLAKNTDHKSSPVIVLNKTMQDHQKMISEYNGIAIVSLMDIVAFDDINILYGFEVGTQIVSEAKTIITNTFKELESNGVLSKHSVKKISYDLFHVYEDKLCLFIKNDLNHRLLDLIIKKLLAKISKHKFFISDNTYINLNVTFGATKADGSVSLLYAEKALQEAKKSHNNYMFYDSTSFNKNEYIINNVYETLLANIEQETITPYFQAIFDVHNNSVPYKYESLMRLLDGKGQALLPGGFMDKSKEYRLYTQLMSKMIDKVFNLMVMHDVSFTLNLSYIDINNIQLCNTLIEKVKEMNVGSSLTIEIVETEQIEDFEQVTEFIFALKKLGVSIAIDDFGCGFSNFDILMNLDVDYVKLDGSLVSKIHNEKYRMILENIVNICHDLGIKTIAEYISDDSIMQLAKGVGVDYLQGYHLHKPEHWKGIMDRFELKGDKSA